jgi:hypothetical protein
VVSQTHAGRFVGALLMVGGLALPAAAGAHLERPSYWPDPAPDTSVTPPAGGAVPKARSLASAVTGAGPGVVRVVCQENSLKRAQRSIRKAQKRGFRLRPSQLPIRYSAQQARRMKRINRTLFRRCAFDSIQAAVTASANNDRIVIMPGRYTEPDSRAAAINDPKCNPSMLQKDASGDDTPSYRYQVNCPNDQNLIHVAGRGLTGDPPATPLGNRQGIPASELGPCVRCNLQIEGSGAKPIDVIIDAGDEYDGAGPEAKPAKHAKHVVLRVDRADGFVGRNFTMNGAKEFGFYVEETDGVLLDKTKFFWNADYGHLSFTTDHNLVQNCDGYGSGDSVVYPGAAPETGSQATDFYPDAPRYNTTIRRCDLRGSALGYSGSMGNAVRITNNHIYGNTTGIASDTLSAGGHPGFPADSSKIDHNFIYSNNFDIYDPKSPVDPLVPVPIGTGIIYAGMNDARVHDNWIFDNWRNGTMLLAVPDALVSGGGAEGDVFPGVSCATQSSGLSTSCGNHYFNNKMGQVPPGFVFPKVLGQFGVPHGDRASARQPNGTDFWWDEFRSNTGNCWFGNVGSDGTAASVTGAGEAGKTPGIPPNPLPDCAGGQDPSSSTGAGDDAKTIYLVDCSNGPDEDSGPLDCDWWTPPAAPGSAAARAKARAFNRAAIRYAASPAGRRLQQRIEALAGG